MAELLWTEWLKLKRSKMMLLSLIGSCVAPLMVVFGSYIHVNVNDLPGSVLFEELFFQTNLYTTLLIGVPLYGVMAAYLFQREYAEDTLKNLLTIPVSRTLLVLSKMLLLYLWILLMTLISWGLALALGWLGAFPGLDGALILKSGIQFLITGTALFILSTPVIFVTLVFKSLVPSIVLTIVITLVNVMGYDSDYRDLIPWSAAFDLAQGSMLPTFSVIASYISIAAVSICGFTASLVYFRRADIH